LLRQLLSRGLELPTAAGDLGRVMALLVGKGWRPQAEWCFSRQHMAKRCCVTPASPDGGLVFLERSGEKKTKKIGQLFFW